MYLGYLNKRSLNAYVLRYMVFATESGIGRYKYVPMWDK